jgi:hypothetical protein
MSRDLVFGQLRRDWSLGSVPLPKPDLTSDAVLSRQVARGSDRRHEAPCAKELILRRAREAAPTATRLYEEYRPTIKDRKVILTVKTDLLGGER